MSKEVVVEVRKDPEVPGYNDTLVIIDQNHFVFACPCSAGPNERGPWHKGGKPWKTLYGRIAPGKYVYECIKHYKYGKCLLINYAAEVPSRTPNPNHSFRKVLTELFVHKGWSKTWRGSAGCPVVHPEFWQCFQWFFEVGDVGNIVIVDV